jgi:hypothetical protein
MDVNETAGPASIFIVCPRTTVNTESRMPDASAELLSSHSQAAEMSQTPITYNSMSQYLTA